MRPVMATVGAWHLAPVPAAAAAAAAASASADRADRAAAEGRSGADDRAGGVDPRVASGNPDVRVVDVEVLADDWHALRKVTFDIRHRDGRSERQDREVYDRGHGAAILLYDPAAGCVLLTRQFRMAAYVGGHPDGMLIEVAAGNLDDQDPAEAIRREAHEEAGVVVGEVERLFDVFTSPGSVTERLHCFAATYRSADRLPGGGLAHEGEDIEVLELPLADAVALVAAGEIVDAKTIMLLQWAQLSGRLG